MDYYGTADGFRAYHTARNRNVTAYADDAEVNGALLVASERNDARYRSSFTGTKVGYRSQAREFPRVGGWDRNGDPINSLLVPVEMEYATYEAALRELVEPGSLSLDYTPSKYRRAAVTGAVSVEYVVYGSAMDIQRQFLIIDELIAPILTGVGNWGSLSGAAIRV